MPIKRSAPLSAGLGIAMALTACAGARGADEPRSRSTRPAFDAQGHRGARGLRPENTLPAFEVAMDFEVSTLELDLHLTRDDVVVVWHDPVVSADKCEGDGTAAQPAIRSLTYAELRRFRCSRNPDPKRFPEQTAEPTRLAGDDYRIASLDDLLSFVETYASSPRKTASQRNNARRIGFNIETKRVPTRPELIGDDFDGARPGAFERGILAILARRRIEHRVVLQSFDHRSLWAAKQLEPGLRLAALTDGAASPAVYAERGAAIWSPNHEDLTEERWKEATAAGLLVIPWTVNDADEMRSLISRGVDGIISDRPDVLMEMVRNAGLR